MKRFLLAALLAFGVVSAASAQNVADVTSAQFGGQCNGTDQTAVMNAALLWLKTQPNPGGTIYVPCFPFRLDGAIFTTGTMPPIRLTCGAGAQWSLILTTLTGGGGGLDLRYDGSDGQHPAQIDLRAFGEFTIDHCTIISGGASTLTMVQITNTVFHSEDNLWVGNAANGIAAAQNNAQDVFKFGSTSTTAAAKIGTMDPDSSFMGYGTRVHNDKFKHVRIIAMFGAGANGIVIDNAWCDFTCGFVNGAPYFFTGAGLAHGSNLANVIINGGIEMSNYSYLAKFLNGNASNNTIAFVGTYDGQYGNALATAIGYFGDNYAGNPYQGYAGGNCGNKLIMPYTGGIPLYAGPGAACQQ